MSTLPRPSLAEGDVLVRLPARTSAWVATLPRAPEGERLTVTLGHPDLMPRDPSSVVDAGYRIVGAASDRHPIGATIDVYVPAAVREAHPAWWQLLHSLAERVFDLRLGPVQLVLANELELHTRALAG